MTRVAEATGLGRESLYKTLRPGSKPGFATVSKLLGALGVSFKIAPTKVAAKAPRKVVVTASKKPAKAATTRKRATA